MGGLLLTVIELAKTIETIRVGNANLKESLNAYSRSPFIAKAITFIFRFLFHSVQFTFLFRYGNVSCRMRLFSIATADFHC